MKLIIEVNDFTKATTIKSDPHMNDYQVILFLNNLVFGTLITAIANKEDKRIILANGGKENEKPTLRSV